MKNSCFAALLMSASLSAPAMAQDPCYGKITDRNNHVLKIHDGCYYSNIDAKRVCTNGFPDCFQGLAIISTGGGKRGINYHETDKILKKLDLGAKELLLQKDISKSLSLSPGN